MRYLGRAPRPFVAFAAVDYRHAARLYRAQNVIWMWLGIAAVLSAVTWLVRPSFGPALVGQSELIDALRNGVFAFGGGLIAVGVWSIRRELEILGHVLFATGALMTAVVTASAHVPGSRVLSVALTAGVALASGLRAFFLVEWLGAAPGGRHAPPG